ncbi:DASS family sodium-coupled anion symporter [Candidatus Paraluminiphilus aquimaris]|uniref:DASS family sodium-coupled anion symporter n=1 Tax=Candidatus Paraluminiphilus aquimaris TaxID=2518994 RepID=A0ABY6Q558_9GAMM|nr:DASS family sodium-coupled anion symporter [Candidatus Paraluminiphilus aquimaris]
MVTTDRERSVIKQVGLWAGPLAFFLMLLTSSLQETMSREAWLVAGVGFWMATWWSTEAIPVAATAFIPLVSFPLLQVMPVKAVAQSYAHPTIFLFMGAFVLALAVEKWSLHRRIALSVLSKSGTDGRKLILGFMVAAALLSMWMTNTSTAMMLLPIAASVAAMVAEKAVGVSVEEKRRFQVALLLALAYATTIGGMSTIIGTPPNVMLAGFIDETYGLQIAFFDWMLIGLPLALVLLPLGWVVLTRVAFRVDVPASPEAAHVISGMRREMGAMTSPERRVGLLFLSVVLLWMSRKWLNDVSGFEGLSDAGIVMAAALLLFVVPSKKGYATRLMEWEDVSRLPWGVLILFGGGLALAAQVSSSGLAVWLGESLLPVANLGTLTLIVAAAGLVVFLTELTSNLATTATFLPVIAAIAAQSGIEPLILCVPVTLAASCAFMLPVATPPNAIVFSSGVLTIPEMVRAGFVMNLVALVVLTLLATLAVPLVF